MDTHIFLWAITEDTRLTSEQKALYQNGSNELYLSVVSIWEMLIKTGLGKLQLPLPAANYIAKQIEKNRLQSLSIRPSHLAELEDLPPIHRDPFDRMLVAQARAERMPILSADPVMRKYEVTIL